MADKMDPARTAENLIRVRHLRGEIFPSEIFDEHAWNMLLRLFVARSDDVTLSEAELIALAEAPTGVGQRWLAHLVADGQVEAYAVGGNPTLTKTAIERMDRFLDMASAIHDSDAPPRAGVDPVTG